MFYTGEWYIYIYFCSRNIHLGTSSVYLSCCFKIWTWSSGKVELWEFSTPFRDARKCDTGNFRRAMQSDLILCRRVPRSFILVSVEWHCWICLKSVFFIFKFLKTFSFREKYIALFQ